MSFIWIEIWLKFGWKHQCGMHSSDPSKKAEFNLLKNFHLIVTLKDLFEETPTRIILLPSSILMISIWVWDFLKLKFILKAFCDDNKSLQAMSAELLTEIFLRRRCKLPWTRCLREHFLSAFDCFNWLWNWEHSRDKVSTTRQLFSTRRSSLIIIYSCASISDFFLNRCLWFSWWESRKKAELMTIF